jgi:hypothetical protein
MELKDYIKHVDRVLKGLESLETLEDADIPNFNVHGLLIFDDTRESFDIISLRELNGTFRREFRDATEFMENGIRGYEGFDL